MGNSLCSTVRCASMPHCSAGWWVQCVFSIWHFIRTRCLLHHNPIVYRGSSHKRHFTAQCSTLPTPENANTLTVKGLSFLRAIPRSSHPHRIRSLLVTAGRLPSKYRTKEEINTGSYHSFLLETPGGGWVLETRPHSVAQIALKLSTVLPQRPKCWHYWC